ncbi:rho GTPase-activating protein 7 [Conger conger]|uniref:rho GTPase-activating protein 7 n=1 Tax=Conger conger TaxID=82655 RepID=UPI002A59C1E2|nr:rho GTPase-activating protein 7 [Conger conger]
MARVVKVPLRRSFSEHVKESTSRAWDVFWRSVREKRLAEIEAKEACEWLRAAGFPQYVQLFRDCQFPVDVDGVKSDHTFLEQDAIDSLCRRLHTLNRCAEMRLDTGRWRKRSEESEEEEPCAISGKWSFERGLGRWSRQEGGLEGPGGSLHSSSSSDGSGTPKPGEDPQTGRSSSPDSPSSAPPSPGNTPRPDKPPRRQGHSLVRKMERLRLRGNTLRLPSHGNKPKVLISGPVLQEGLDPEQCVDLSGPPSDSPSPSQPSSPVTQTRSHRQQAPPPAHSPAPHTAQNLRLRPESLAIRIPRGHRPGPFPTAPPQAALSPIDPTAVNWRTGSFHGHRRRRGLSSCSKEHGLSVSPLASPGNRASILSISPLASPGNRTSVYDNVPTVSPQPWSEGERGPGSDDDVFSALDGVAERISSLQHLVSAWSEGLSDSDSSPGPPSPRDVHLELQSAAGSEGTPENGSDCDPGTQPSPVHRRLGPLHWPSEPDLCPSPAVPGIQGQSASQMNRLQKLSLLRLSTLMDTCSPHSRQGWGWTVPKTLRKTLAPHWEDGGVFGVPLLQTAQQTGYPLPPGILKALHYLRAEGLGQVGLFRKSGVKSRIQQLREMVEAEQGAVSFEGQSAFDVADMVKQYFRDLPEPVFSSKLCESFLHIYQYFPKDRQFAAVQAAIFLLPDENREALHTLLLFLRDVAAQARENQMSPTNLAVCLAPSLFHLNTLQRGPSTRSSHRKHSLGRPSERDLSETLAATQGLAHMVGESVHLFQVPKHWQIQAQNALGDEPLQEGRERELELAIQSVLREARQGAGAWAPFPSTDNIHLAYKKEEVGAPPRCWKGGVEVGASVGEVLQRLLQEQELWEEDLLHHGVIQALGPHSHVYHYCLRGVGARAPQDHLLLRTWRCDPSSGASVLAAVSTDRPAAPPHGVRAQVLTCVHLLEPLAERRTRLTHICCTDTGGRSPHWYHRVAGLRLALQLGRIRDSFRRREGAGEGEGD